MRRACFTVPAVTALIALAFGFPSVVAAEPNLTLNPSSGNPPSVRGSLGGSSWLCPSGAAPLGGATVSGPGVSGSAAIDRAGRLTGDFTVSGTAGQWIPVNVKANLGCPGIVPIYLEATATFTFNAPAPSPTSTSTAAPPPTPVPTHTLVPTAMPTAVPTPVPTLEPTPVPTNGPTLEPTSTLDPTSTYTVEATLEPTSTETAQPIEVLTTPTAISEPVATTPTMVARSVDTPKATATVELAATATPSAVASGTPTTPTDGDQGSLTFVGCSPPASQVKVEFLPLGLMALQESELGTASGPAIPVAVTAGCAPNRLSFQPPSAAEAGRLYQVSVKVDDPQCPSVTESTKEYWLAGAGKDIAVPLVLPGDTSLQVSNNGDQPAKPVPVVKGVFVEFEKPPQYGDVNPIDNTSGWLTEHGFYGSLKGLKQRFRWGTDLTVPVSGTLQVGWLPFPKGYEDAPFSPPGLLASWPVQCVNCEFVVDLSPLPAPEPAKSAAATAINDDSLLAKLGNLVAAPFKAIGNLFSNIAKAVAGLFGGSKDTAAQPAAKTSDPTVTPSQATMASSKLIEYQAANQINALSFKTFYFRILPLKDGKAVGDSSNMVVMHWLGDENPLDNIKIINPTPTATPTPSAYQVEIVSYHGVIPPVKSTECYLVLEDAWMKGPGFTFTTQPSGGSPFYKKGQVICPPAPKEPSFLEKIGSWVSGAVNWVSEAYNDLKDTVISAVGYLVPDALCDDSCVGFILDVTLIAMGIPPDLPNFDQLMNEGLDYLAEQAVAQIGLPPEVLNQTGPYAGLALAEAEAKFKEAAQAKLKEGLQQGVKEMQLGYTKSVSWLPEGVPVRPDDYQQPAMTVKVTRKPGVPGGEKGCSLEVRDYLTIAQSKLDNPPPGWEGPVNYVNDLRKLSPLTQYDFFANDPSLGWSINRKLAVPPLASGGSVTIPMSFKPNVYESGWSPNGLIPTSAYFTAWNVMHLLGTVHLSVSGCGNAKLDIAASANYVATGTGSN